MIQKLFEPNYVIYNNISHSKMVGLHIRNERTGYEKIYRFIRNISNNPYYNSLNVSKSYSP